MKDNKILENCIFLKNVFFMKNHDVFRYTSLSSGNQVDGLPLVVE